ncbi:GNAT family N-acetyltransferase [Oceanicaulis sp. MMSF_3324]|uniref:GNAT family N-acetyltransferase n=1 Tax=Oceanicaulis sp. MMSF_3324 TaxID=3046702 RepID=UPI00273E0A0F|nr:GNAT family protein [Oceanicaulis sp. MMSF_3324]
MQLDPQTLENAHVRLEPLSDTHREALRPLAQEEELWSLTTKRGDGVYFDPWFDGMLQGQAGGTQISHAVWSKATGAYAGHTAFLQIDRDNQRVEIGWTWYGAAYRGGVTNPACKALLLEHAFGCGAERVELKTHHLNERSQAAMLKLGAIREGTLRSHTRTWRGDRRDTVFFSILPEEWPGVQAGLELRLTNA